jgi:hypothetical protein
MPLAKALLGRGELSFFNGWALLALLVIVYTQTYQPLAVEASAVIGYFNRQY